VLTFHNPMDAKLVRELAQKGGINSAVIIGGGYIGCELAEALTVLWGIETTIIERENRLLFRSLDKQISNILEKRIIEKGISLILSATVHRIGMDGSGRFEIFIEGEGAIKSDIVFFCTGVKPDSKLAQDAGIKTGRWGGIVVNQFMQTSVENIYAGGDCIEILNEVTGEYDYFPLGSLANRQGKVIADSIARNLRQESDLSLRGRSVGFSGAVGAVSMKVYDLIVASTGITEARAKELHIETGILCASFYDRPHYHPDNRVLYAKVVYEVPSLRLLGLQLAGEGEVTRYIDLFSYLLLNGLDSYTLLNLEHAYNPPHSSPINPLNFIGSMIIAQEEEGIEAINPFTFRFENFEGQILELREESEIKSQPYCDSAICIPSDELRERYRELDKGIPLLAVCQKGPRAYEAVRFLKSQSYEKVFYLAGGVGMLGD
jgi:NADPH-dependent 2,4-dienoyl-CoA reductase/sulfur reductase-like enzyme/rhodanese-related sulfurtransferase